MEKIEPAEALKRLFNFVVEHGYMMITHQTHYLSHNSLCFAEADFVQDVRSALSECWGILYGRDITTVEVIWAGNVLGDLAKFDVEAWKLGKQETAG